LNLREAEKKLAYYKSLVEKSSSSEAKNAMAANLAIDYEKRLAEEESEAKRPKERSLREATLAAQKVAELQEENEKLKDANLRLKEAQKKSKEDERSNERLEELEDENITMKEELQKRFF
jgi:hypothetical protein